MSPYFATKMINYKCYPHSIWSDMYSNSFDEWLVSNSILAKRQHSTFYVHTLKLSILFNWAFGHFNEMVIYSKSAHILLVWFSMCVFKFICTHMCEDTMSAICVTIKPYMMIKKGDAEFQCVYVQLEWWTYWKANIRRKCIRVAARTGNQDINTRCDVEMCVRTRFETDCV